VSRASDFSDGLSLGNVHLLGASGQLSQSGNRNNSQANRLYRAEGRWAREVPASREDLGGIEHSQDYLHKLVHHPDMDRVPGINALRGAFMKKDWIYVRPDMARWRVFDGTGGSATGAMTGLEESGDFAGHSRIAIHPHAGDVTYDGIEYPSHSPSGVNHEAAHVILNYSPQFQSAAHGWPMARTHLHITQAMLGPEAAAQLARHYDENKVNYGGAL
jgi:hypothetical protein